MKAPSAIQILHTLTLLLTAAMRAVPTLVALTLLLAAAQK
jgi:hypothetical protein